MYVPKPVATGDPAGVGPVDLVLVAVKTWQIPDVAAAMGPLLGDGTVVLPLLNGVEASDELAAVIGAGRALGGLSRAGPPYADVEPVARALLRTAPERALWGTDWPHPNMQSHMPDDGALVDWIMAVCDTPALRRQVLVDNPARLYWPDG